MFPTLDYRPRWYHLGDPDNFWVAIAYGFLTLATISVLEHIVQLTLFSTAEGICFSDISAMVTYSSCRISQILHWLYSRKGHHCSRAVCGIIFRLTITLIDLGIIYLSIPQVIPVRESDLLATQLSWKSNASVIKVPISDTVRSGCKDDAIRYEGFTGSASRHLCMSALPGRFEHLEKFINRSSALNYVFVKHRSALKLYLAHDEILYSYFLKLSVGRGENTKSLRIQLPDNIISQAVNAFRRIRNATLCNFNTTKTGALVSCPDIRVKIDESVVDPAPPFLFSKLGTETSLPNVSKVDNFNQDIMLYPMIGFISRPPLSIAPAVLLLSVLLTICGLLKKGRVQQDLKNKLWTYFRIRYEIEDCDNPLEAPEFEFSLDPRNEDTLSCYVKHDDYIAELRGSDQNISFS